MKHSHITYLVEVVTSDSYELYSITVPEFGGLGTVDTAVKARRNIWHSYRVVAEMPVEPRAKLFGLPNMYKCTKSKEELIIEGFSFNTQILHSPSL